MHYILSPIHLISQTSERLTELKPALINGAYTACFTTSIVGILPEGAALPIGIMTGFELTRLLKTSLRIDSIDRIPKTVVSALSAGGFLIAEKETMNKIICLAEKIVGGEGISRGTILGISVVGAIKVGMIAEIGVKWILNRRAVDQIDRKAIGIGILAGSLAGMVSKFFECTPLQTSSIAVLIGSATAGIFSSRDPAVNRGFRSVAAQIFSSRVRAVNRE